MSASFFDPLERAWTRTRSILFSPFSLEKWCVMGFAAFLAGLVDGGGTGGASWGGGHGPSRIGETADKIASFITASIFGMFVALGGFVVFVILLWVSSRGKFIFLDNAVQGRGRIAEPWGRYARQGNSLFVWRLVFTLIVLAAVIALLVPLALFAGLSFAGGLKALGVAGLLYLVLVGLAVGTVVIYVSLFLDGFVVPIMFQTGQTTSEAWKTFLPLLRSRLASFVLFGIVVFLLTVAAGAAAVALGLLTCCVGFILLALPYIGSVVILPISVTYRLYTVEFLAQLEPRLDLLAPYRVAAPAAPVVPPPPPPLTPS